MNARGRYAVILALALLGGAALVASGWAAPGEAPLTQGGAPAVVAYQGEVRVGGAPYSGDGHFKFAVVNAAGNATFWSNDGTSTGGGEPTAAVGLVVSEGLFSVLLGDTALGGMREGLDAEVFSEPDRYLRVWFSTSVGGPFTELAPDTRIAAVPYALQAQEAVDADTVDGLHASELGTHYQNVVVVAQSGGDYVSVQAAIDSITDAAADNAYLVWVAPGVYQEQVTMKPYVHLQGAGQEATVITSAVSTSDWPPTQATLVLTSHTSLRDLTLGNGGMGDVNVALLAKAGVTRTLAADVTARADGGGVTNLGISLSGNGTGATLQRVTALAHNGSSHNIGLANLSGAAAVLHGGVYTARGGTNAWGIFNSLTVTMKADNVTALGEHGSNLNKGMYNWNNATVVLYGGDFTGRGGSQTGGTGAANNSTLTAYGVTALAEDGSGSIGNYAMGAFDNSTVVLSGGVFIARGGVNNYALSNELTVTMKADHVTALAENGSSRNCGLWNVNSATLVLHGASLTGRGGTDAYGIYNGGSGTALEADSVAALGENGGITSLGLFNTDSATANVTQSVLDGEFEAVHHDDSGQVTVSNSRLVHGAVSGTVTCVAVSRDNTFNANGCP
jgi:hypothetical protein